MISACALRASGNPTEDETLIGRTREEMETRAKNENVIDMQMRPNGLQRVAVERANEQENERKSQFSAHCSAPADEIPVRLIVYLTRFSFGRMQTMHIHSDSTYAIN